MKKAVIYARVSSKDQEREGYSIPAQLELLREFAKKEGYQLVSEFVDVESAKEPGRTQFTKMVKFLKKARCDILVEKTDRLYRNYKDALTLEELKVEIRFVKQGLSLGPDSKSSDKLMHSIHVAMAKHYSDNLSEEVKKGLNQKASQGTYPGGTVPLGYYRQNGEIQVNVEISAKIRHLYELYSTGDYSITGIHEEAKKIGLRYFKSGRFITRSEAERILKKPFYCGRFIWNGKVYQGDHPAVVSVELFNRVQDVFKGRNKPAYSSHDFPFIGLIKCGECGHSITAEIKKGKYIYYHCTGYGGKCKPLYIDQITLDRQFGGIIKRITIPTELHDWLRECLEYTRKTKRIEIARQREKLESEKAKIETRLKKAYTDKLEGKITEEFWDSIYQDTQTQLLEVNYQLQQLELNPDYNYDIAQKAIELSYRAESLYLSAESADKRRLLKSVLSNCELRGGTLYPTYKKPFDILSQGHEPDKWRRGRDSKRHISVSCY